MLKLFNVSFNVDPYAFSSSKFFPSVIWDLEEIEGKGGFLTGDDGVVISLLSDDFDSESVPANEKVSHHNWHYDGLAGYPYGYPGVNTPVAVDDFISTTKDVPVRINVIVNDYHLDGIINPYSLEKGTYENNLLMPTNGKVKIDKQTGEMTYFPHSGFSGIDTYEYEICDNEGLCDIGLVTISVISDISASVDNKDIGLDGMFVNALI